MAVATSKRLKSASVKHASLEQTGAFLQALPEKPKEELSLKEAVGQLQVPLRAALAKGYSYQELAAMLAQKGINISAFTLKNYVPSGKRSSSKEKAPAKTTSGPARKPSTRQSAAKEAPATSSRSTAAKTSRAKASTASDSASTDKPTRSRKSTTAAKSKTDTGSTVKQSASERTPRKTSGAAATSKSTTTSRTTAKPATSRRKKTT